MSEGVPVGPSDRIGDAHAVNGLCPGLFQLFGPLACLFPFFRAYSCEPVRPVVGRAYDIAAKYISPHGRFFPDFRLAGFCGVDSMTGSVAPDEKGK